MKLKEKKIRWLVAIPLEAAILVKKGDKVKTGQMLAEFEDKKINLYSLAEVGSRIPMGSLRQMVLDNVGAEVAEGDVLGTRRKIFGKTEWRSPGTGKVLGIDEFGNLVLETVAGKRQIISPVAGKVVKVDKDKLSVEFMAAEIKGEILAEGKSWGITDFVEIERWLEVTSELKGKVIWVRKPDPVVLTKAVVMGVTGVVTADGGEGEIKSEIPVIKIDEEAFERLVSEERKQMRVWINSKKERLLLMLE